MVLLRLQGLPHDLEVSWPEPLAGDHPLLSLENVVTPHLGYVVSRCSPTIVPPRSRRCAPGSTGRPIRVLNSGESGHAGPDGRA
jgi:hypothetical protein